MEGIQLKRKHIFTKTFIQIFLYVVELLLVSLLITYSTTFIEPITSSIVFLERIILAYTIYQILVIVILTNLNDIEKDSYLALITILKLTLIYIETRNQELKSQLQENLKHQLNNGTFNSIDLRNDYEYLQKNLDTVDATSINIELIIAEHQYELQSLNWKFSFILRSRSIK